MLNKTMVSSSLRRRQKPRVRVEVLVERNIQRQLATSAVIFYFRYDDQLCIADNKARCNVQSDACDS